MLIVGGNQSAGGYDVDNSLRFNKASTDYLNRTFSTPTSTQKCTYSGWIKRSKLNDLGGQYFLTYFGDFSNAMYFNGAGTGLGSNDQFVLYCDPTIRLYTNRLFRDPSAWYHIVVAIDTTQATASNRVKIYVNGVQETSFATETYPAQNGNLTGLFGATGSTHDIGRGKATGTTEYFGGYMSEIVFIDGLQLDPTSFGEFDEDSGIWKPIDVSGLTFGNNGFYLDFEDSSALGNDVSGNNNDFTVNNLTAIDQTTDTCTNNFATLNPLQTDHSGNTSFSEGNNKFQATTGDWVGTASTQGTNTGKWYAEFKLSTLTTSAMIGVATDVYMSDRGVTDYVGFTSGLSNYAYAKYFTSGADANEGKIFQYDQTQNTYGSNTGGSTGDIIGVALDLDNNKLYFSVNGTWENSGDPAGNSNGYTIGAGTYQFGVWGYQSTSEANFGSPPFTISSGNTDGNGYGNFEYAVPSGYYSLNTKNLAEYG